MIGFVNKKTGEFKQVFSAHENKGRVYVKFTENGKEYRYNAENIEIINVVNDKKMSSEIPFGVYTFKKQCYKCYQFTDIITYIIFSDGTNDDVTYPWDKRRLLKGQNIWAHIEDPSIEYYGLNVVGENQQYDNILMISNNGGNENA